MLTPTIKTLLSRIENLGMILLISLCANSGYASTAKPEALDVAPPTYPKLITQPEGSIKIHMPQVETWKQYETITASVAMEVTLANSEKTWIGSLVFEADSDIDFDERLVVIHDARIIKHSFQDEIEPPQAVKDLALKAFTKKARSVPLDVVLRALPDNFKPENLHPRRPPNINTKPPAIFVATSNTALMMINGKEIKVPIANTELDFVVNTNWDLFYHKKTSQYYVLNGKAWQKTQSLQSPKWKIISNLPSDFAKLPNDSNWNAIKKMIPAQKPVIEPANILVSFEPAELILIAGKASLKPIEGTSIHWVSNTEADLFKHFDIYYYLVSGRWFKANDFKGPWAAVEKLPDGFAKIPADHAKASVLAAVPHTIESRIAAIEAQIPRKASISVDAGSGIEVVYDGAPKFVPIEGTNLQRAVNTAYQVIFVNGKYYLCYNAVWFSSQTATGAWQVASNVPEAIYKIPATDPSHNVTYVYVQPSTSSVSTHVSFSYTAGYYGYYAWGWGVAYGTGWYYPPYHYPHHHYGYPAYWYYPVSYGYGSWYNSSTGRYGERSVAYGPYGGIAATSVYNPRTGGYARGEAIWDNDELVRSGYAFNPSTSTRAAGNMYYDFRDGEGWRESYVERGDRWVYGETRLDGNKARTDYTSASGIEGTSVRRRDGNTVTGSGEFSKGDRSLTSSSQINSLGAKTRIEGDSGGDAQITKQRGSDSINTTINTADNHSATATTTRSDKGNKTDISGAQGGQGTSLVNEQGRSSFGKSQSGDLYASQNGNVYKRSDSGSWSHYNNGSWNQFDRNSKYKGARSSDVLKHNVDTLNRQQRARHNGTKNFGNFQQNRNTMNRGSINRSTTNRNINTNRVRR